MHGTRQSPWKREQEQSFPLKWVVKQHREAAGFKLAVQTEKAGWALGRVHSLYASAPKPLMSKATPRLLGPSAPWFDPQPQKGNTESQ